MGESLNDKAVSLLSKISKTEKELHDINDYTESSGLCIEYDQIMNDAHVLLGSLRARIMNLHRRIQNYKHNEVKSV